MSNQERALESFMENNSAIIVRLEMLKQYFENHMEISPDDVTWAAVGSEDHVLEMLDEVIDFLGLCEGGN